MPNGENEILDFFHPSFEFQLNWGSKMKFQKRVLFVFGMRKFRKMNLLQAPYIQKNTPQTGSLTKLELSAMCTFTQKVSIFYIEYHTKLTHYHNKSRPQSLEKWNTLKQLSVQQQQRLLQNAALANTQRARCVVCMFVPRMREIFSLQINLLQPYWAVYGC